jgi:glutathione gamma-glutamylcysteinyltransferase
MSVPGGDGTFYRRPLPDGLVPFASPDGRRLFQEALAAGTMEGWFPLAEQFHTQSDPAFCGLGTLVVALNALEIDPGRIWKGPWRWYAEELLDCCLPLEEVRAKGITLDELACLARCNGATATVVHAEDATLERFQAAVERAARSPRGPVLVAAYSRAVLGQTGQGHFSPLAGYHAGRGVALVLDVARFKYPPHWAPLDSLWRAMQTIDPASGRSRGFISLERDPRPLALLFRLASEGGAAPLGAVLFEALPRRLAEAGAADVGAVASVVDAALGPLFPSALARAAFAPEGLPPEHRGLVDELLGALRGTGAFGLVDRALSPAPRAPLRVEALTMLLLALPEEELAAWPAAAAAAVRALRPEAEASPLLAGELAALREQLLTLRLWHARGACAAGGAACAGPLSPSRSGS